METNTLETKVRTNGQKYNYVVNYRYYQNIQPALEGV